MKAITNLSSKEHMDCDVAILTEAEPEKALKFTLVKRLKSEQLFNNVKEVMIEHLNETYILRITKQNKLILTK